MHDNNRFAVDEHRACAAMAFPARDLGAGQRQFLAERFGERRPDLGVHLVLMVVDGQLHVTALDLGHVHEPVGQAHHLARLDLLFDARHRLPQVARRFEQLADPVDRLAVPVPFGARVDRQPEHPHLVGLARPEERCRHRQVLVDPRKLERNRERVAPHRLGRLWQLGAVGKRVRVPR